MSSCVESGWKVKSGASPCFLHFVLFLNEALNPVYPNISIHILHIVFYIIISKGADKENLSNNQKPR